MKITTKSRYAIRAMCRLACGESDDPVTVRDISKAIGVTEHYLNRIFFLLRRKKLVRSVRGPGGGYMLSRSAGEITLLEIIEAVEERIAPVWCVDPGSRTSCSLEEECPAKEVWVNLQRLLQEFFQSVTLSDLVKDRIICQDAIDPGCMEPVESRSDRG